MTKLRGRISDNTAGLNNDCFKAETEVPRTSRTFPPELWSNIAFFACTDGGKTASSLLRVSKAVSHGADPHAYHVVALMSRRSIICFLNLLVQRPEIRAQIRSLFISGVDSERNPVEYHPSAAEIDMADLGEGMRTLAIKLLKLVAPTLVSLALIARRGGEDWGYGIVPLLNTVPMLALQSLTLRTADLVSEGLHAMPTLMHLHISVYGIRDPGYLFFVHSTTEHMPSRSRLTLSEMPPTIVHRRVLEHFFITNPEWSCNFQPACIACLYIPGTMRLPSQTHSVALFLDNATIESEAHGLPTELLEQFKSNMETQVGNDRELYIAAVPQNFKGESMEGWLTFWLHEVVSMEL